jgi:hypothetical protein
MSNVEFFLETQLFLNLEHYDGFVVCMQFLLVLPIIEFKKLTKLVTYLHLVHTRGIFLLDHGQIKLNTFLVFGQMKIDSLQHHS